MSRRGGQSDRFGLDERGRWRLLLVVLAVLVILALVVAPWPAADRAAPSLRELAKRSEASVAPSLSRQAIPPTDLPPEGTRSLFDHLLKENGGLPFPFSKLLDLIASYDRDGRRPVTVLIPDGRSLLKAQASFAGPRIVAAADARPAPLDGDFGVQLRGRLFVGYVEAAHEIEVLSYNEDAGRFEFQLVSNYTEGGVPVISYARRSLCVACHQGEAPIFPERPWDETNSQPAIADRILQARQVTAAERAGARYFGALIVTPLASAETLDDLVNVGNAVVAAQRLWIDGCGDDAGAECRREMLRLALRYLWRPSEVTASAAVASALLERQGRSWPKGGIGVANPSLPNRNPLTEEPAGQGIIRRLLRLFSPARPQDDDRDLPDSVRGFDLAPPPRAELDPLTPRAPSRIVGAGSIEGVFAVAAQFAPNDGRLLEQASGGDLARLDRALGSRRIAELLGPLPLRRVALMSALLAELGVTKLPRSCCTGDEGMSPPLVAGAKPLHLAAGSPLEPFERYCFACHRGNPALRLDFMSGDSEEQVLAHIKEVSKIREVLDYERYGGTSKEGELMPPRDSTQRQALDRARADGKDDLERMARVVPDTIGF